jgi:hypothetical protein
MYLILALPRSRTAWLSHFLTYGQWTCGHETLPRMRSLSAVEAFLARPRTGTAETAAASWWRLLGRLAPETKIVVIRRPVNEVVESLMAIPGIRWDRALLTKAMIAGDRKLDQIEARLPCLSVPFADLAREDTCKAVFEYCLPYQHDPAHWARLATKNIQIDVPTLFKEMARARPILERLTAAAKRMTFINPEVKQPATDRIMSWQH